MKQCSKCKNILDLNSFYKRGNSFTSWCKTCVSKRTAQYKKTKLGVITHIYSHQKYTSNRRDYQQPSYTKNEFIEWMMSNELFHTLYDEWVDGGYISWMKPSVDRINDYVHYCFENIQLMTWRENQKKGAKTLKKYRAVNQFTKDGIFIQKFDSIMEASIKTDTHKSAITMCCRNKIKTSGGFVWRYQ